MTSSDPFLIGLSAQFLPGVGTGGVETAVISLVQALGELTDGPENYLIAGPKENPYWLEDYLGPNQKIVVGPEPVPQKPRPLGPLRPMARRVRDVLRQRAARDPWLTLGPPSGFFESLGCRVVHFPFWGYQRCEVPTVFNPHDLQHLHFPEYFSPETRAWRAAIFPLACRLAHTVVVGSEWIRQDVVRHFELPPQKVQVIPWAAPRLSSEPSDQLIEKVRVQYDLEPGFALYPAMTWPHKNHLRLLEALALLRDERQLRVHLVCTGHQNEFWSQIQTRIHELELDDQVRFLGLVPAEHLRPMYRLCGFVVVPTLFEAASGPIFEAWQDGAPVACSTVTSLPQQARDAALFFDPLSVADIAQAVATLATDSAVRMDLREKGFRRLSDFSWDRTARGYRAVYRRAAGVDLTEEERELLETDWMADTPDLSR